MPNLKLFKTKEEYNKYYTEYRQKNLKKLRAYNREYNKKWRKENGYHNEINSQKRYPEKVKARSIINNLIYTGKLIRGNCAICDKPKGQAHHEDYNQPLKIIWLCPVHHREADDKLKNKEKNELSPIINL